MSRIYVQQKRPGAKAAAPSYDAPAVRAPSLVSGQSNSDLDALMQAKYRQHFLDNQIPTAEAEADRIAASVSGARTPEEVKTQLGEKMGADFSNVTFHTDSAALKQADAMGARAYTTGSDVYFGSGGFDPGVAAHELVHTVQQGMVGSTMQTTSAPTGGVQMKQGRIRRFFRNLFRSKAPEPSISKQGAIPDEADRIPEISTPQSTPKVVQGKYHDNFSGMDNERKLEELQKMGQYIGALNSDITHKWTEHEHDLQATYSSVLQEASADPEFQKLLVKRAQQSAERYLTQGDIIGRQTSIRAYSCGQELLNARGDALKQQGANLSKAGMEFNTFRNMIKDTSNLMTDKWQQGDFDYERNYRGGVLSSSERAPYVKTMAEAEADYISASNYKAVSDPDSMRKRNAMIGKIMQNYKLPDKMTAEDLKKQEEKKYFSQIFRSDAHRKNTQKFKTITPQYIEDHYGPNAPRWKKKREQEQE